MGTTFSLKPRMEVTTLHELDDEWLGLLQEMQDAGVSKTDFKEFLRQEQKKRTPAHRDRPDADVKGAGQNRVHEDGAAEERQSPFRNET